jgi:hypothetical protein
VKIENFLQDNEGQKAPTVAALYYEQAGNVGSNCTVDISGFHLGTIGPTAAAILIKEGPKDWPSYRPVQVRIRDANAYAKLPTLVRVDGPGTWARGTLECLGTEAKTLLDHQGPCLLRVISDAQAGGGHDTSSAASGSPSR